MLWGKEKAHKHKQFCPVIAWVRGGLPTEWSGVKCLCAVCGTQETLTCSSGYPAKMPYIRRKRDFWKKHLPKRYGPSSPPSNSVASSKEIPLPKKYWISRKSLSQISSTWKEAGKALPFARTSRGYYWKIRIKHHPALRTKKKVGKKTCPSFPRSFRQCQGKPQEMTCEPLETLGNEQKPPKKTKTFRSKKNTKETKKTKEKKDREAANSEP